MEFKILPTGDEVGLAHQGLRSSVNRQIWAHHPLGEEIIYQEVVVVIQEDLEIINHPIIIVQIDLMHINQ